MNFQMISPASPSSPNLAERNASVVLIIILILTIIDITVDLFQGVEGTHIAIEALVIPLAGWGLFSVWRNLRGLTEENQSLKTDVAQLFADASQWKTEAGKYVNGLSEAIDGQLSRWNLSAAEKEVALLILKGLSLKEIATIRDTSERTVRHQANATYQKSGLRGRADLAAFFLEDLLTPHS